VSSRSNPPPGMLGEGAHREGAHLDETLLQGREGAHLEGALGIEGAHLDGALGEIEGAHREGAHREGAHREGAHRWS
jgi:hypothetical protein